MQWGESSFNLSEWGDSLLVGEYFLERQSLLRQTERTEKERDCHQAQPHNTDYVRPVQHLSKQSEPSNKKPQPDCIASEIECDNVKTKNSQGQMHKMKQLTRCHDDTKPGGRQEWINKEEQAEKDSMQGQMNVLLSDDVPEGTPHCSPGVQEIFDRWPSISEQSWQNPTTGQTDTQTLRNAAQTVEAPALPQPTIHVDRKREELNLQLATAESDSHMIHPSRHDARIVPERPSSAGDLIPPTQETPPVTPRVKLTTSSVQSPLTAQPLNQSTPALGRKPAVQGTINHLPKLVSDNKHPTPTCDHHNKGHLGQAAKTLSTELTSVTCTTSKTKRMLQAGPNFSSPQACASRSILWPKLPSDTESPVDEGFSLQLSQDELLCSSNSGTFSIIDVGSDRCLFNTFIEEWKTKERFSLALACEKKELRQEPQNEIGGKHKRGNHKSDFNLQ